MGIALQKLAEEDPTFRTHTHEETGETIIAGMGELHLDIIVDRMRREFNVEATVGRPQVAYRETIRSVVENAECKFAKQSGGRGQYGHVVLKLEPMEPGKGFEFVDAIKGGVVPREYIPAVEKGVEDTLKAGVLAGYPLVGLKAVLYDGSYHPVDSSEIAFKTAANLAYKAAMPEASPVLLEPVCELKVTVPDQYMGDILGDLNKRRGRVMGMTPTGNGEQVIEAECPEAELMSYAIDLRSMTQSRGSFVMHFVRYEQCSADAQAKAVAAAKAMQEAE